MILCFSELKGVLNMTALRQQAIEIIERIPENSLHYVIQIMQGVEGLIPAEKPDNTLKTEKQKAYDELISMIKPLEINDEKKELEDALREKYGL